MHVVVTTFADEDSATAAVHLLVRERLAACGTLIGGARSIYRWKDAVEEANEVVVLLKTTRADELAARLKELHPYETPEIATFEASNVSKDYADWLREACTTSPGSASL